MRFLLKKSRFFIKFSTRKRFRWVVLRKRFCTLQNLHKFNIRSENIRDFNSFFNLNKMYENNL